MKQDTAIRVGDKFKIHTPEPWAVGEYSSGTEITGGGGQAICFFAVDRHDEGKAADESRANAQYLVHCVNHHNFVVDELKMAIRELERSGLAFDHPLIVRLRRTVAKADGEC